MQDKIDLLVGALNGAVGDYLEEKGNPLAQKMAFFSRSQPLDLTEDLTHQIPFVLTNKLVIFAHGLTNTEAIWNYREPDDEVSGTKGLKTDYGKCLAQELGFTPFYLRYNSGLAIIENGIRFHHLISDLLASYPLPVESITIIGYSMGGLISRRAQHEAMNAHADWIERLSTAIYIGTPHEGARLEKLADVTQKVLEKIPKDYVSHWSTHFDRRSTGIKDLKHGLKFDSSLQGDLAFHTQIQHHFISGSVSRKSRSILNRIFGDSLVTSSSAKPASTPDSSDHVHFEGIHHIALAHHPKVYETIKSWLLHDAVNPLEPTDRNQADNNEDHNPPLRPELLAGAAELFSDAYVSTLDTVETMHRSIAQEPFGALRKSPFTSSLSLSVESIHNEISKWVYASLRLPLSCARPRKPRQQKLEELKSQKT